MAGECCRLGFLDFWILAPPTGRQGHPGVGLLLGNICLEGVGGRRMPLPAATTRSPDGTFCRGVSRRRPEAPLELVPRSAGVHFLVVGRWV